MSSSDPETWTLADRLLVQVAERLGPGLDVVDVTEEQGIKVRELVLACAKTGEATPAEVRAALLDLVDLGHLVPGGIPNFGPLQGSRAEVRLTDRGLVAARRLRPGCGRSVTRVILRTRKRGGPLNAIISTGARDLDRQLNRSGTVLACFYLVAAEEPTRERPLVVEQCMQKLERLAVQGVARKSGPGEELASSAETVFSALEKLGAILPLRRGVDEKDGRRDYFYLDGPWPEVVVDPGAREHCADWQALRHAAWRVVQGKGLATPQNELGAVPPAVVPEPKVAARVVESGALPLRRPSKGDGKGKQQRPRRRSLDAVRPVARDESGDGLLGWEE